MPNAMNTMELVSIYDQGGTGGVFFIDVKGDIDRNIAPIQFTLSSDTISGFWATKLLQKESVAIPTFAIGVHDSGDWHHAVDYYLKMNRPHWIFPEIPDWLRDQDAIYGFSGGGGGGSYLLFPAQSLDKCITSFEELPKLLDEAKQFGTDIIYLWDYWARATEGGRPAYWKKDDYIPRSGLGGDSAFRNGIQNVHRQGGRVIVYVESFIIFDYSQFGKEYGQLWGSSFPDGNLYRYYKGYYTMAATFRHWQDYLVGIAEKLVRDYNVDGIFLDSWAWRIIASPVRYGLPEINFCSNGRNLSELNQIYAAGHSLALANKDLSMAPYINRLVSIRQKYKDALIYRNQQYQPSTGDVNVAAYFYQGERHSIIIVVNTSEELAYSGLLFLKESKVISRWRDLITEVVFEVSEGRLFLEIQPKELRILICEDSVEHTILDNIR